MKVVICSVFDKIAGTYGMPFFAQLDKLALRSFSTAVNTPGSYLHTNPSDFDLFHIGQFDDETGAFINAPNHVFLANGSSFKQIPTLTDEVANG